MKTPDEIKNGLSCCHGQYSGSCGRCHYSDDGRDCGRNGVQIMADALVYIQQLEAKDTKQYHRIAELEKELAAVKRERDALYSDLSTRADACDVCKHGPLYKNDCEEEFGDCGCAFEWQGVCKENTEVQKDG